MGAGPSSGFQRFSYAPTGFQPNYNQAPSHSQAPSLPRAPSGPISPSPGSQNSTTTPPLQSGAMVMVATSTGLDTRTWYPDSGATHHLTADIANLAQRSDLCGANQIFKCNGQGLSILSVGSTSFSSPLNPHLSLNNLLHVPAITKNLVSISKFARDNSIYFEFHPNSCFVKSQADHQVLLEGTVGPNGLHHLKWHLLHQVV